MEEVGVPSISFHDKFLLIAHMADGSQKYFSSIQAYNEQLSHFQLLNGFEYTAVHQDENADSVRDELKLRFDVQEENVASVELYLFLQYEFDSKISLKFTDMVKLENKVETGTSNKIVGHFELYQKEAYSNM
jgi:hypothetical protein